MTWPARPARKHEGRGQAPGETHRKGKPIARWGRKAMDLDEQADRPPEARPPGCRRPRFGAFHFAFLNPAPAQTRDLREGYEEGARKTNQPAASR